MKIIYIYESNQLTQLTKMITHTQNLRTQNTQNTQSTENLKNSEDNATSNKRIELDTQCNANSPNNQNNQNNRRARARHRNHNDDKYKAKAERIANMTPDKRAKFLERKQARDDFKLLPIEQQNEIKEKRKKQRELAKLEKDKRKAQNEIKKQERIANMSPERQIKLLQKKQARDDFNSLPISQKNAIKEQRKKERELVKLQKQNAKEQRIANMSLEKYKTYMARKSERDAFKNLSKDDKLLVRQQKAQERQKKAVERDEKKKAKMKIRLAKLGPEKLDAHLEKLAQREQLKTELKNLPKDVRKLRRKQLKEQKQKDKFDNMTLKKQQAYLEKQAQKDAFKQLPAEEQAAIKSQKKAEREARKERYTFLSNNWVQNIPNDISTLIVDGNNMRGGGPKRSSRNDILDLLDEFSNQNPRVKVICFFDHNPSACSSVNDIEIIFSKDVIADDRIVNLAEKESTVNYLVITCDRLLALRIIDLGGKVMRNKTFKATL